MKDDLSRIVVGIVVRKTDVLLVRRRASEESLRWQFPGGEIEPGETPTAALEREVNEETGIVCTAFRCLGSRMHPVTRREVEYWLCTWQAGDPFVKDPEELDKAEWVRADEVEPRITGGVFQPVLNELSTLIS